MKKTLRLFLLSIICLCGGTSVHAAGEEEVNEALSAIDDFRYGEAYRLFSKGAEKGNLVALRSAGMMALYGDHLYGTEVELNLPLAQKWLSLAAKQGCNVSGYLLSHLTKIETRSMTSVTTPSYQ